VPACARIAAGTAVSREDPIRSRTFALVRSGLDLLDIPVIFGALVLSYLARFRSPLTSMVPVEGPVPPVEPYLAGFAVAAVFQFALLAYAGTYSRDRAFGLEHVSHLVWWVLIGGSLGMMGGFLYRGFSYSRLTLGIGLAITPLTLCVWHGAKWRLLRALSVKALGGERTLVVGDGDLALESVDRILADAGSLVQVVGFCRAATAASAAAATPPVPGGDSARGLAGRLRDLGPIGSLRELIRDHEIDRVVVALPSTESEAILGILAELDETSVQASLIADRYSLIVTSVETGELSGVPAVHLGRLPIHGFAGQIKHFLDFWLALAGLAVLAPALVLVAIAVKLDSPGPVFYVQERVGLDGRYFRMYKFRSMRRDAEAETGPVWAKANDPRCTRLGRLLRKYSIDELPQLLNVVRGEMSLVGPRPERPEFVEGFRAGIPRYMSRHKVRSGITGWAQISGLRGQAPIEERTRYDIWYIENWSLALDFRILLKTIYVCIFQPTGI
jgi:exopolysaccharide biosynthesis polyprenyl glycosylphosphotransferase